MNVRLEEGVSQPEGSQEGSGSPRFSTRYSCSFCSSQDPAAVAYRLCNHPTESQATTYQVVLLLLLLLLPLLVLLLLLLLLTS